jgi:HEAT repeat protein/S1-C subfamily serine protease
MLEFTCPKCQRTTSAATLQSGKVLPCPGCGQRLCVVVEEAMAAPPAAAPGRGCVLPCLAGVCGLGGVAAAAVILLAWFLLGRTPAPDNRPAAQADGPKAEAAAPPAPKKEPTPVADVKPEPPRDDAGKKEPGGFASVTPPGRGNVDTPADDGGKKPGHDEAALLDVKTPTVLSGDQVYKKLLRSCVWVVASDGTSVWTGTGALVDRDERLVITNEHVANRTAVEILALFPAYQGGAFPGARTGDLIKDPDYYLAQVKKGAAGKAVHAEVVRADRQRDLALIKLASVPDEAAAVPVAVQSVSPGQTLHAVGGQPHGSKAMWIYNSGVVRQVSSAVWQYGDGFRRSGTVIESTMPINQGDSGGPVVDGRGFLVGVNAGFDPQSRQNSSHIDVTEVRDLVGGYFRSAGKEWSGGAEPPPPAAVAEQVHKAVKALASTDADLRRRAAVALGSLGRDARDALPDLLRVLRASDEKEEVRQEAARALGELGTPPKDQLPALEAALRDARSKAARLYAADALGKLGPAAKPALPPLVQVLGDADPEVRRTAAAALGKVGLPAREEAYARLLALLQDQDEEVRRTVLGALVQLGRPAPDDVPPLKALLANRAGSCEGRIYAAAALSETGPEAVPLLLDALAQDSDPRVVMMACAGLGEVGQKTKAVGQALARTLDREEKPVRVAAAAALGQLGIDAATLAGVFKALGKKDVECRRAVLAGLPSLGAFVKEPPHLNLSKAAVEDCKPALTADEPVTRAVAAYLLGTLGADAGPAVPELCKALAREKNDMAEREILCALAEIGPAAKDAVPELKTIISDPTAAKLPQTCAALALVQVAERDEERRPAYPVLAKALEVKNVKSPDPLEYEVHLRAQKALQKGKRAAAEAIIRTPFLGTNPDTLAASKAALHVLEKIGPAARGSANPRDAVYVALLGTINNKANDQDVIQAALAAFNAIYRAR